MHNGRVINRASQGPRAEQGRLAASDVITPVPDLRTARTVIEELGRRGIEAELISLTGPAPQEAATQQQTAQADREMLNYWFRRTAPWGSWAPSPDSS